MADKTFSLATDSMQLQVDGGITESDGIFSVPLTMARHMVQDYAGLKVLKPATELEAAVPFTDKMPVTRAHPESGIVTARDEVYGFITNPLFENDELRGILQTADKDLVADIKSKKLTGLSLGFFCNVERKTGTFGDAAYDAVQTDIFPNHIALLEGDLGRCSLADGCGIHTDSKKKIDSPPDLIGKLDTAIGMAESEYGNNTLKDLLIEIKEMVVAGSPAGDSAAIAKVTAERDTLKEDLRAIIQTEKDSIIKELTAMQDAKTADDLNKLDLADLKKELDMVKELRTGRLSFKQTDKGGKSAIDDAYSK